MFYYIKKINGITLVSLIITTIIILILSGIVMSLTLTDKIFEKTRQSASQTKLAQLNEFVNMIKNELLLFQHDNLTQNDIVEKIKSNKNFIDCTVAEYENGNIILTTSDKLYDIIVKKDLVLEVFEHSSLLQGTWLLNDVVYYPTDLRFNVSAIFSNNTYSFTLSSLHVYEIFGYNLLVSSFDNSNNPYAPYGFAYIPENSLGYPPGWVWGNMNTLETTPTSNVTLTFNCDISEVTDDNENVTGEQLLDWLQKNAVKL